MIRDVIWRLPNGREVVERANIQEPDAAACALAERVYVDQLVREVLPECKQRLAKYGSREKLVEHQEAERQQLEAVKSEIQDLAARLEPVTLEDRARYDAEWAARNPISAYRLAQGELEWRETPQGGGYFPRESGRTRDGAVFVGFAPDPEARD